MALHGFQLFVASLVLLLVSSARAAAPGSHSHTVQSETKALKVTCKIFVTETGVPKSVEVLNIEPSVAPSEQEKYTREVSRVVLTWTFNNANQENGKPVAGYLVVPVMVELESPLPVNGT